MQDYLSILQTGAVMLDQAVQGQGMGAIHPGIGEPFRPCLLVQEVRQALFLPHILTPNKRVPNDERLVRFARLSAITVKEPVILTQVERNPIIGRGLEHLEPLPDGPGNGRYQYEEQQETKPLPYRQAHCVTRKRPGGFFVTVIHVGSQNWK